MIETCLRNSILSLSSCFKLHNQTRDPSYKLEESSFIPFLFFLSELSVGPKLAIFSYSFFQFKFTSKIFERFFYFYFSSFREFLIFFSILAQFASPTLKLRPLRKFPTFEH